MDQILFECIYFQYNKFNWKKSKKVTKGKWPGVMYQHVLTLIKMVFQKFMIHLQVFYFIRIFEFVRRFGIPEITTRETLIGFTNHKLNIF